MLKDRPGSPGVIQQLFIFFTKTLMPLEDFTARTKTSKHSTLSVCFVDSLLVFLAQVQREVRQFWSGPGFAAYEPPGPDVPRRAAL